MKPTPISYSINMAACREANEMLTKENKELRAKLALRDQVVRIGRADYPPTQAQIEAARETPSRKVQLQCHTEVRRTAAAAAAAEARPADISCPYCGGENGKHDLNCGLYSAEAGRGLKLKYTDKDLHDCEQDTIERCAQVVSNYLIQFQKDFPPHERLNSTFVVGRLASLVAAIRAMRD